MLKTVLQKVAGGLLICVLAVSSLVAVMPSQKALAAAQDCGPNAVLKCGVVSLSDLKAKYRQNQGGNVNKIYAHYSIPNEAAMDGMVKGRVTKSGDVFVNNVKVAQHANSAGRTNLPGSTKIPGVDAYMRVTGISFQSESLDAYVQMRGGMFRFAVLTVCGNPVQGYPIVKPKPTPTPTPTPTPEPEPEPEPENPGLEITKDVRLLNGTASWQQEVTAEPDGRLQYRITVENTGDADLENLRIQDSLPEGMSFTDATLEGSEEVQQFMISDLVGEGIELDALEEGGKIEIFFTVTVASDAEACEEPMQNIAFAEADDVPEEDDDALVKVCQPETPIVPETPKTPQVKAAQTAKPSILPVTGAAGIAGIFSVTSLLGVAAYKLKEFYSIFLR